jgi:very-short-patch-repair endonuclease
MSGKRRTDSQLARAWRGLLPLAATHHGLVSRAELRRAGLTEYAIEEAIRLGRLHRVFRGVYALGRPGIDERGRMCAATLVCGSGTVVSHRSAAFLLGLLDRAPVVVDVIAPDSRGRKVDGIRVHLVRVPERSEAGTVAGIPCTSPARTIVDLAGIVSDRTLRSVIERAAAKRILDIGAVETASRPGIRGAKALRTLTDQWRKAAPLARRSRLKSPLEAKVLPLLAQRNLPTPGANVPVRLADGTTIEVDFLWAEQRFVLEADSRDFHGTEVAFERDRWRDRELMRIGFSSLRVTSLQAESEPEAIAETISIRLRANRA